MRSTLAAAYASIGALPLRNSGQRRMVLLLLVLVSCAALRAVRTDAQETLPSSASQQGVTLKSLIGSRHVLLRYWHHSAQSAKPCGRLRLGPGAVALAARHAPRLLDTLARTEAFRGPMSLHRTSTPVRPTQQATICQVEAGRKHAGYCLPIESRESFYVVSCEAVFVLYCSAIV